MRERLSPDSTVTIVGPSVETVPTPPGTTSSWPTNRELALESPFRAINSDTVVPKSSAITERVSPHCTTRMPVASDEDDEPVPGMTSLWPMKTRSGLVMLLATIRSSSDTPFSTAISERLSPAPTMTTVSAAAGPTAAREAASRATTRPTHRTGRDRRAGVPGETGTSEVMRSSTPVRSPGLRVHRPVADVQDPQRACSAQPPDAPERPCSARGRV